MKKTSDKEVKAPKGEKKPKKAGILSGLSRKEDKKTEQQKVDERREEVLARGRKFKYPLQFTRHRVVVNTILISVIVVVMLIVSGWLALYQFGMTSEMLYRVTKMLPVPAAVVDGERVLFSDYLMFYRSSVTSIERQQSGAAGTQGDLDTLRAQYKRSALTEAEEYAYATKMAKELSITVSNEEVTEEFLRHLSIGGVTRSEEGFLKVIDENFGLSKSEYERMLYLGLLKAKVEQEIDTNASKVASRVETLLMTNGGDFVAVAGELGDAIQYQETGGMVSNQNIDGGRALAAAALSPGEQSGKFVSMNGDGYYFVKLVSKSDTEVNFVSIKVPFTEFSARIEKLREDGLIEEYVPITSNE